MKPNISQLSYEAQKKITLDPESTIIRDVCWVEEGTHLAILTQMGVSIYNTDLQAKTGLIRRLGYPRAMAHVAGDFLLVQYSDNITHLYNWRTCEKIYSILGLSSSTTHIRVSKGGQQLLLVDHQSLQLWEVRKACISLFLSEVRNINCAAISQYDSQVCCGTYGGSVVVIKVTQHPHYSCYKVSTVHYVKNFNDSVMGIGYLAQNMIVSINLNCQVSIVSSAVGAMSVIYKCDIGENLRTMELVSVIKFKNQVLLHIGSSIFVTTIAFSPSKEIFLERFQRIETNEQNNDKLGLGNFTNRTLIQIQENNGRIVQAKWNKNCLFLIPLLPDGSTNK